MNDSRMSCEPQSLDGGAAESAIERPAARRWCIWSGLAVSALLGVITFAPAASNGFVYDDDVIILRNRLVTQPGPWHRIWLQPFWPREWSNDKLYRPLTTFSYRLNTVLAGKGAPDARSFHIVNVVLHALTCAGVFVLAYRLTGRAAAAWIAGVLFATNPVHTEAVVTGYGRAELLAGFFGVWLLARHVRPAGAGRPRTVWFHLTSSLLFLAAVMSKEHALFLWPAILAIDLWPRRQLPAVRVSRREWLNRVLMPSHVGFVLAIAVFLYFRVAVFGGSYWLPGSRLRAWEAPLGHATLIEHLLTPFRLLWVTLGVCVWPPRLCPVWSIPALPLADRLDWDVIAGMILLGVLLIAALVLWRRRLVTGALVCGMLLMLAMPVQALPMANWLFAERWLYLHTVFIAVLVGVAVGRAYWPAAAFALAIAIVLLPASWSYTAAFESNLTMNREIIRRQPNNFQGRRYMAQSLLNLKDYTGAVQAANEMIERFGEIDDAYRVLLVSYLELGEGRRALEAINAYERLRAGIPEPGLYKERQRAQALIAREPPRTSPFR